MTISVRPDTITTPERFLGNGAKLTADLQRYYSIFLWDLDTGTIPVDEKLDPAGQRPQAEFFFTVAPKTIEVSEPFTTKVVSTQNGGKFIESHGSIFKNIRIQGTTGVRPNKTPVVASTRTLGMDPNEITGFDDITFLRNIFRRYSDYKAIGRKIVMVWRNIKDDDYWIVEPSDFKVNQQSRSPLSYEYTLTLQGVSKFDIALASVSQVGDKGDSQATIKSNTNFVARVRGYASRVTDSLVLISTYKTALKGAGYFSLDKIFTPLTNTVKLLASVNNSTAAPIAMVRRSVTQTYENVNELLDVIETNLEVPDNLGVVKRHPLVRELRRLKVTLSKILTETFFADSIASTEVQRRRRAAAAYTQTTNGLSAPVSGPRTGGDPSFVGNARGATTVAEGAVNGGETIRDLARRLLGDARRWHELVILNDLRPPYTADTSRAGVLGPGDPVLYPSNQPGVAGSAVRISNPTDDEIADIESYLASQAYGRDCRLQSVTVNNGFLTDLVVNQQGDISTIVGVPNVEQAIRIKFATELGELPAHPGFGAQYGIGSKADIASFNTFRLQTLATLKSDLRVSNVESLSFETAGDILQVSAKLELKNTRDYLSTDFSLRRF